MLYFPVWQLAKALGFIIVSREALEAIIISDARGRDQIVSTTTREGMISRVNYCRTRCSSLELASAVTRIDEHVIPTLSSPAVTILQAHAELKVLIELLETELKWRRFAYIPTEKAKKCDLIDHDWKDVQDRFPSAIDDIRKAVECYALDCNTASVFHSMRVAERGLRALARKLKVKRIGPQKHPLEFAEWGQVLSALRSALNAVQQSPGRNARKAATLKFFADAASQADYLNEIWRKEVSHARGLYNAPEAFNALTRTHDFMTLLAQRIKESS